MQKKFIHIDMDCFYAAVEMRDNPELRHVPLAIGGRSRRGVLSTANYIARQYGVRSAMSNYKALQLCPQLVIVPGRMQVYKDVSRQIRSIFNRYTDLIEPLSLDEAYLDVTNSQHCQGSATLMAEQIRNDIYQQTGLTASAGVAPIKFLAKIASDENKPNGQCVITPDKVRPFLMTLPLGKIPGVGKVTLKKLHELNLYTGQDVIDCGVLKLVQRLGNWGQDLYDKCNGDRVGTINTDRVRKSLSVEHTYEFNKTSLTECLDQVPKLMDELARRIIKQGVEQRINKLSVKVKFSDFVSTTADQSAAQLNKDVFNFLIEKAYQRSENNQVRLLGLGVGLKSEDVETGQLSLM